MGYYDSNMAQTLSNLNSADRYRYKQPSAQDVPAQASDKSIQQQTQEKLIGAAINPYQNMQSNWNNLSSNFGQLKNDYTGKGNGLVGTALDTYAFAKNPMGNNNQQAPPQQGMNLLGDQHLDQPDSNGLRKINGQGRAIINTHLANAGIADNSGAINPTGQTGIPTVQQAQNPNTHGWVGRFIEGYAHLGGQNSSAAGNSQSGGGGMGGGGGGNYTTPNFKNMDESDNI